MNTRGTAAIVAAAAVLVYWGARSSGFVGDDFMILHRLRDAGGLAGSARFFRGEFFEYYRPLGFVLHGLDWTIAGGSAPQFHLTNILLHAINAVLVFLIARQLAPGTAAAPVAALLFALHASNHEAVVWISARFDLLATSFSLAAVLAMLRLPAPAGLLVPALLFFCATISKEASVAMPLAAAGFAVFARRASTAQTIRLVAPWLTALAAYSGVRRIAGGVSAIGGASRLPKLAVFLVLLVVVVALADGRWLRLREWLRGRRGPVVLALAAGLAALCGLAAAGGHAGQIAAEKLAVAGFSIVNLATPWIDLFDFPFYLRPETTIYWLGGGIAVAAALATVALLWRRGLDDDRIWFLAAFLLATLLPISALTEGTRYLYLPSAALSLIAGVLLEGSYRRARGVVTIVLAVYLAISTAQIVAKIRDWQWAGALTASGAALVDASLAPACGEGQVVFLTEPVAIRGVYTHFLYETFEIPRGCLPAVFQNLVRIVRTDAAVDVVWDGSDRVVMTIADYRGNASLSRDLRNFDPPIPRGGSATVQTPLGEVRVEPSGTGERLTLSIAPSIDPARVRWFYYSAGAMHALGK